MNKLLSVLCALSNDWPIENDVPKFYRVILFKKGKCHFRSNGSFNRKM